MDKNVDSSSDEDVSGNASISESVSSSQSIMQNMSHRDPSMSKSHRSTDKTERSDIHRGKQRSEGRSYTHSDMDAQEPRSTSGTYANEDSNESINETSLDETSFTTSVCSEMENRNSSELSVDPVVWKKFKFLSSILKVCAKIYFPYCQKSWIIV